MQDKEQVPMARLQVIQGESPNSLINITRVDFTIGRDPNSDLCLPDAIISRHHAHLKYAQGNWFIQDKGSKGGTYVNGEQVLACQLNPGDQISIGDYIFAFSLSAPDEAPFALEASASSDDEDVTTGAEAGVSTRSRRKVPIMLFVILAIIIACVIIGVIAAIILFKFYGNQISTLIPFLAP